MVLQAIKYDPKQGCLSILNQLLLPHATTYDEIASVDQAWQAIRSMRVRGAPAIAIVAALSVAVELHSLLRSSASSKDGPSTGEEADSGLQRRSLSEGATRLSVDQVERHIFQALDHLLSSRPTAVNLADAVRKLKRVVQDARQERSVPPQGVPESELAAQPAFQGSHQNFTAENIKDARSVPGPRHKLDTEYNEATGAERLAKTYIYAAEAMLEKDVQDNEAIGHHGALWILGQARAEYALNGHHANETSSAGKVSVLTHCNTGSLATAGYGTALGVIRSLHSASALERAYCTETRPYNQGSRLTAYELVHDGIPSTLIADSMAGALFASRGQGGEGGKADGGVNADDEDDGGRRERGIAAVVVGADRVAANGDTANKVGTYSLAVLARHHGVRFVVAAPRTSIDLQTPSGRHIVIEQRPAHELGRVSGALHREGQADPQSGPREQDRASHPPPSSKSTPFEPVTVNVAAPGIDVWNPAFDVTPAALIDAIVTEVGVVEKNNNSGDVSFELEAFVRSFP